MSQGWGGNGWDDDDWNGGGWDGGGHAPATQPRAGTSPAVIAVIVVLVVLILALLGTAAYFFLRPGGVSGEQALPAVTTSSSFPDDGADQQGDRDPTPPPVTATEYTTPQERETVTVTREAPPTRAPESAGYPSGADRSGWVANRQARCNAGDPAAMIGRTSQASFSICTNPDNGRYYYRGSAGGNGVEIDDPVVSGYSATVTNAGVTYSIDSSAMRIYEGGSLISDQPMTVLWAR